MYSHFFHHFVSKYEIKESPKGMGQLVIWPNRGSLPMKKTQKAGQNLSRPKIHL
jgi:hypothetical protein